MGRRSISRTPRCSTWSTTFPSRPSGRRYQRAVEKGLIALCKATHGRALVLFTSNVQLRTTARAIAEPLSSPGIRVLEQSEGASRQALLERFRTSEGAVLLGTRSFWEGVDVPGEALSVLVIVRLPFDVPSDPIIAARSETYELALRRVLAAGGRPALPPGLRTPDPHPI